MKCRTHIEAARRYRAGYWSCDDLQAKRLQANANARSQAPRRPTPREIWEARTPIREKTRVRFPREIEGCWRDVQAEGGVSAGGIVGAEGAPRGDRIALARERVALELLQILRGRVPLPLNRLLTARNS